MSLLISKSLRNTAFAARLVSYRRNTSGCCQDTRIIISAPWHQHTANGRMPFVSVEQALSSVSNTTKWAGSYRDSPTM